MNGAGDQHMNDDDTAEDTTGGVADGDGTAGDATGDEPGAAVEPAATPESSESSESSEQSGQSVPPEPQPWEMPAIGSGSASTSGATPKAGPGERAGFDSRGEPGQGPGAAFDTGSGAAAAQEDDGTPGSGHDEGSEPGHEEKAAAAYEETSARGYGEPPAPVHGETSAPGRRNLDWGETPAQDDGGTSAPGHGEAPALGYGTPTPGYGGTSGPDHGEWSAPGHGESSASGPGEWSASVYGESFLSGSGEWSSPGYGESSASGSGESSASSPGEWSSPGYGGTGLADDGRPSDPRYGETPTPLHREPLGPGPGEPRETGSGLGLGTGERDRASAEPRAWPDAGSGSGYGAEPGPRPGPEADPASAAEPGTAYGAGPVAEPDQEPGVVAVPGPRRRGPRSAARRASRRAVSGTRPVDLDRLTSLVGYRYATALLVLLALLALYGVAAFSRPSGAASASGRAHRVPVSSAVLGCPAPGGTRLSMLSLGAPGGGQGRIDAGPTRGGTALGTPTAPGKAWAQNIKAAKGRGSDGAVSYTVRANGALAAGLEAEQTTVTKKGKDRGVAGLRCAAPGTDMWFLGPGPVDADDIELHLTNVDDQPAAVDVLALSGEGPLDTSDGRGTSVAPHTGMVVRIGKTSEGLGDIVNTSRILGLHVHVTTGRVVAAVRARIGDRKGADWVPAAASPATEVVVPGIPDGGGRRQLLVAVPGDADARVRVQVITSDGSFAPEGRDTLDAPAQTVTPVDLERALSGKAAAVRLSSDRPITAGFSVGLGIDVAYGAAVPPLRSGGDGAVSDARSGSALLLTAPAGAATVRITPITGQGAAGGQKDVRIAAGRTVQVAVPAAGSGDGGDAVGVTITPRPGSAPVYAARVLAQGKGGDRLMTIMPIAPAPVYVLQPPVGDSLTSVIP